MAQPRFRRFAFLDQKAKEIKKLEPSPPQRVVGSAYHRGCITALVILLLLIVAYAGLRRIDFGLSMPSSYEPPMSRAKIGTYSESRRYLQMAHEGLLATSLAWFHRSRLSPADGVAQLDATGFLPFLFDNEKGERVPILDASVDYTSRTEPFLLAIVLPQGPTGGFVTRRNELRTNIFGESWPEPGEETILVNPRETTSIHAQFLPASPQFAEEYVCFLAHWWESAASSYIKLYQRPPDDLESLMDGLGLVPNPACVWPFDPEARPNVDCECGVIDAKIVYWQVTLAGGATRGQARYWDQYTSFDDPDTPESIVTAQVSSPVVDPGLVRGSRQVMFSLSIVKSLLDSVRPPEVEEEPAE